jgi:hypothetical protein
MDDNSQADNSPAPPVLRDPQAAIIFREQGPQSVTISSRLGSRRARNALDCSRSIRAGDEMRLGSSLLGTQHHRVTSWRKPWIIWP